MIAYLDLPSGLSGDMFLGCLVDAGWPLDRLLRAVSLLKLPKDSYSIQSRTVQKGPLRATLVDVQSNEQPTHRYLSDIQKIIATADLPSSVQQRAINIFTRLATAESKVHGTTIDKVHFHEVGAIDAIIDIVGASMGIHELAIEKLYASPVPLGHGWTQMEHGRIPLPAPATLEILSAVNASACPAPGPGELITPTGAAILAELATFSQPEMSISKIATGSGQRDFTWPNVARMWLGEPTAPRGAMIQLETNIDDMNPQLYPNVMEKLLAAGARDVWLTPIQMKKGRPGVILSVLAPVESESALAHLLLRETTTLGVRVSRVHHRHEAAREFQSVDTPFGPIRVKVKLIDHRPLSVTPEYEDCLTASQNAGVPLRQVHDAASAAAHTLLQQLNSEPTARSETSDQINESRT